MIKYYHGSHKELEIGQYIKSRKDYESDWGNTDFYQVLEYYKPDNMISHKEGVFMCDNDEDIDLAGGAIEFIYEVIPIGIIEKHDLNWSSEISCLISRNFLSYFRRVFYYFGRS